MTRDAVACFGCGEHFAPELLEDVGDTVFCRACLGRMLRRVDERGARPPGAAGSGPVAARGAARVNGVTRVPGAPPERSPAAPGAPGAKTAAVDAPCFVCGEPFEGQAVLELRGFAICARCARDLMAGDAPAGEPPPSDGVPAAADASGAVVAEGAPAASGASGSQPIWTPGTGTEWCHRCGRPMPGPGSYVLVDGRPHCAACATARAVARASWPESADEPAAENTCDACARALGGPTPETQGFRLCAACRSSDPELALALARARHQRRLARATRRLLDGDDD